MVQYRLAKHLPLGAALIAAPLFWLLLFNTSLYSILPGFELSSDWELLKYLLLYPVLEEVCFRGAVQGRLLRLGWGHRTCGGITNANLATSVIFAAFHALSQSWFWSMLILIPSLVFGFMRDRYNNLGAPIALHVFYNTGFFWLCSALPAGG